MKFHPDQHRNQWLDVIRSIAICLVLLSHGRILLMPIWDGFNALKFGGFLGVELFFVLSGYLIGGIMLDAISMSPRPFSWVKTFWQRRWLRTIPNYFLFLLINLLLLQIGIRSADYPDLIKYSTFTQNLAWPHPTFFPEAWSLATEEVFYIFSPLLIGAILLCGVNKRNVMIVVAVLIFMFSLLLRYLIVFQYDQTWDEGIRKISLLRLDSLMVGVIFVAWSRSNFFIRLTSKISFFFCFFLMPVIFMAIQPNSYLDQSWFAKVFLFPMASLGCAGLISVGISFGIRGLLGQLILTISKWSYSAYLSNLPVLALLFFFLNPRSGNSVESVLAWLLFIALTFTVSSLVYRFYESYFLKLREQFEK